MPATIRHWSRASPVMLAGTVASSCQAAEVGQEALGAGEAARGSRSPRGWRGRRRPSAPAAACRPRPRPAGAGPRRGWRGAAPRGRTPRSGPGASSVSVAGAGDPFHSWPCPDPRSAPREDRGVTSVGEGAGRSAPQRVGLPAAVAVPPRRRPGGHGRGSRAGHGAGGLPPRAVPDAGRRAAARRWRGSARSPGGAAPGRPAGQPVAAQVRAPTSRSGWTPPARR